MKIKFILSSFIAMACTFSFVSCSDDDDDDEPIAQQAVGDYNITMAYYLYDGETFYDMHLDESTSSATVTLNGNDLKLDAGDNEIINLVKVAAASNGFTFDVEDYSIEDIKFTGYNAYAIQSSDGKQVLYNGGYINASKKLEFYVEMPQEYAEALVTAEMLSDEDLLTTLIDAYLIDEEVGDAVTDVLDALTEKYRLLIRFTSIKK